jgi:uncharacterized UBP type Zn finger protein
MERQHYRTTGRPLCVKLGTITADGEADVFSYAEDDLVLDPLLPQVRRPWPFGIRTQRERQTDRQTDRHRDIHACKRGPRAYTCSCMDACGCTRSTWHILASTSRR